eukprot:jgi/Psemu1/25999/gm1.25999_g
MQTGTGVRLREAELKIGTNSALEYTADEDYEGERKTNFSNTKVVSQTADVCTKCHTLRNDIWYVRLELTTEPGTNNGICLDEQSEGNDNADIAVISAAGDEVCLKKDVYAPLEMEEEAACAANNKILLEGTLHQCNAKMVEAQTDYYLNDVPHGDRRYCLVVDYCQNSQLPNLGATQPGDAYYMTSLTVEILGIGGNNAASILIMLLKHKGWLKASTPGGELTVLIDNCGGQNKNNHVFLCLANVLVEAWYFKKKDYHRQNIYTFNQLFNSLGTNERITIHSGLESGSIQPGHVLSVDSHAPTVINALFCDLLGTVPALCDFFLLLKTLLPTGIKEIKKIELYEKWRKLVPAEFAGIICPYPGDEVMRKFKDERNHKARERSHLKRVPQKKKAKTQ